MSAESNPNQLLRDARTALRYTVASFARSLGLPEVIVASHEENRTRWKEEEIATAKPNLLALIDREIAALESMRAAISNDLEA